MLQQQKKIKSHLEKQVANNGAINTVANQQTLLMTLKPWQQNRGRVEPHRLNLAAEKATAESEKILC